MKTLVNNLFSQLGLKNIDLEMGTLFHFEDGIKKTFWLIIEVENLNDVIENQSNYFDKAKNSMNNEWFDKNVSLLIIHKVENFENIQHQLLKVEEDPYLFKKQVVLYKESELENLKKILELQEFEIKDFLETNILNEAIFKIHKESINNNDYESLLYRLVQKIPFVKLNIRQENGLEVLSESNTQLIETSTYGELNKFIEQNFLKRNLESIVEMEPDTIYDLLFTTLKSNENK